MNFTPIFIANNEIEANIIKGFLESCGIATKIFSSNEGVVRYTSSSSLPYKISVKETDKERAIQFLKERDSKSN